MGPGEVGEHAPVQGLGLVTGPAPDPALVPGAQRALAPGLLQDLLMAASQSGLDTELAGDTTLTCVT